MDNDFDVIVVGGGLAGSSAAYTLAKEGLEVLIIERGSYAGSKNMTGGRIYAHCFDEMMPDFAEKAPIERKVVRECLSFLTNSGAGTSVEYRSPALSASGSESYVVLRSRFDRWLFEQAEEVGAVTTTDIRVDSLIIENDSVIGVVCAGDEIKANIVILADGVNSSLAHQAGLGKSLDAAQAAVGLKSVFELDEKVITDRAGVTKSDEGAAWLFAGDVTGGMFGGGFCYTNATSISLGLVIGLSHIAASSKSVVELFDDFCEHPAVSPLIKDSKLVEYSAHALSEAGLGAVGTLCCNGAMVVGDAAGFCLNTGYTVRGMDFAVTSGYLAARAALNAQEKNDYSSVTLAQYKTLLVDSYVMRDLEHYCKAPEFLERTTGITQAYPQMLSEIMQAMFVIDGEPPQPLSKAVKQSVKKVGVLRILGDVRRGMKAL